MMLYKKHKALVVGIKKICLEAIAEKMKYMLMCGHQYAG
jgi:hypothetical protein